MQLRLRAYAGEMDKQRMIMLSHACALDNLHTSDLPYRLSSWALDDPENIGLWVDAHERLVAWAVMQTPMWAIDYAYLPSRDGSIIHSHILSWADSRARQALGTPHGHPMWFINLRDDQHDRMQAVEAAGFACQAQVAENPWRKAFLTRPADLPLAPSALPAGISIRPLAGQSEVDAYVALHRSVFESTSMTPAWRSRVLQRAEYMPDLDLVAVTAEGRLAAFCIGWFDAAGTGGPRGQIEPIGVHADFRQRGLGRAILTEALRRLRDHGAEHVYVESDEGDDGAFAFYQSAGFRVAHSVLVYRKDCSEVV